MEEARVIFRPNLNGDSTWTYGNWGGGGWSAGDFTPPGGLVNRNVPHVDELDRVFKYHDIAYEDAIYAWQDSNQSHQDKMDFWDKIIEADKKMLEGID